jgi:hypothetical protein
MSMRRAKAPTPCSFVSASTNLIKWDAKCVYCQESVNRAAQGRRCSRTRHGVSLFWLVLVYRALC